MFAESITATVSRTCPAGRRCISTGRIAVVGLALAVAVLVGGCSSGSDKAAKTTTSTVASPASTTAPSNGSGQNSGGGQSSSGSTSPPSGPGPTIVSFTTPDDIDCHNGNLQNFTAAWSTTDAVKVTISIDGPGVYKTYPASGSDSLPFNCSSSHSFLLTAYGQDGRTATKTITLQPRNAQTSTTTPNPTTTT